MAIDLVEAAGMGAVAGVCELVTDDGEILTAEHARLFAALHDLPLVQLHDLR